LKEEERVREKSLRKAEQLKREREEEDEESGSSDSGNKRRRVENISVDDRSNAPPPLPSGPSEDRKTNVARAPFIPKTAIDLDWEIFQRTVLEAPEHKETYERATVFAEPELVPETPAGFPSQIADAGQQDVPPKMLEELRRTKEIEEVSCALSAGSVLSSLYSGNS
jgi:zinc finger protein 830